MMGDGRSYDDGTGHKRGVHVTKNNYRDCVLSGEILESFYAPKLSLITKPFSCSRTWDNHRSDLGFPSMGLCEEGMISVEGLLKILRLLERKKEDIQIGWADGEKVGAVDGEL
jgi:hypothetical protein